MTALLVLCEVADRHKRARIGAELAKRYRLMVRLTESAFALHTELLPIRVFDQLEPYLGADDRLFVFPIRKPYTGYGPRKATEWLSTYLPTRKEEEE